MVATPPSEPKLRVYRAYPDQSPVFDPRSIVLAPFDVLVRETNKGCVYQIYLSTPPDVQKFVDRSLNKVVLRVQGHRPSPIKPTDAVVEVNRCWGAYCHEFEIPVRFDVSKMKSKYDTDMGVYIFEFPEFSVSMEATKPNTNDDIEVKWAGGGPVLNPKNPETETEDFKEPIYTFSELKKEGESPPPEKAENE